ncbi:hypothetical protein MKJ04_08000 [Pontibacter sp. E15-1]|uniref:hypothetical protein n=1 Tax=Pontibacter sp. E15-1 TaxID=2919918 RepID=UPI001F502A45|nr:hypothetical protein [Pontibacter sp. E15-1]MCJ8164783.1 hypothetical protein [Pontibacter sp. E15-1]
MMYTSKTRPLLSLKKSLLLPAVLLCLWQPAMLQAQSKTKASVAIDYIPDQGQQRYSQRVPHKTLLAGPNAFVTLRRSAPNAYAVEKYTADLKKLWTAEIKLTESETIEAFAASPEAVLLVTHRPDNGQGMQQLYGQRINLGSGKMQESALLLEAPAESRRASVAVSADGGRLLAYRYHTDGRHQIRDISGTLYDGTLQKLQDTQYNLQDVPAILSADVQVSPSGEQFISLLSDNMKRLTTRQYTPGSKDARVMSVLVGGTFDGQKVYIIDSKLALMPNGELYGAVLTADEASGNYYSLKAVKFDFGAEDMVFAEEIMFTPEYLAKVNTLDKRGGGKPSRLEDIYLTDLVLTPEQKLVVIAEKKYTGGGKDAPYFADELHLFAYDEFMNTAWNAVLMKHQQAPAEDAFSGISYSAHLDGNTLHLLTQEELDGKNDLYLRQINTRTGAAAAPKALGINVANDKELAYVKDFTTWLGGQDLVAVVRPHRKADGLRLIRVQLK